MSQETEVKKVELLKQEKIVPDLYEHFQTNRRKGLSQLQRLQKLSALGILIYAYELVAGYIEAKKSSAKKCQPALRKLSDAIELALANPKYDPVDAVIAVFEASDIAKEADGFVFGSSLFSQMRIEVQRMYEGKSKFVNADFDTFVQSFKNAAIEDAGQRSLLEAEKDALLEDKQKLEQEIERLAAEKRMAADAAPAEEKANDGGGSEYSFQTGKTAMTMNGAISLAKLAPVINADFSLAKAKKKSDGEVPFTLRPAFHLYNILDVLKHDPKMQGYLQTIETNYVHLKPYISEEGRVDFSNVQNPWERNFLSGQMDSLRNVLCLLCAKENQGEIKKGRGKTELLSSSVERLFKKDGYLFPEGYIDLAEVGDLLPKKAAGEKSAAASRRGSVVSQPASRRGSTVAPSQPSSRRGSIVGNGEKSMVGSSNFMRAPVPVFPADNSASSSSAAAEPAVASSSVVASSAAVEPPVAVASSSEAGSANSVVVEASAIAVGM